MTKNQKRKDRKLQQLPHMVTIGMTHVATVFAAVTSAARRYKCFSRLVALKSGGGCLFGLKPERSLTFFNKDGKGDAYDTSNQKNPLCHRS